MLLHAAALVVLTAIVGHLCHDATTLDCSILAVSKVEPAGAVLCGKAMAWGVVGQRDLPWPV